MRHTQLFAYLLLLWNGHNPSQSWHWGKQKCSTTASPGTSIPITSTKQGHPAGLNVSKTRVTAYNGTWIPLFGSLHGPIIWQSGSPSAQPHQINSFWYVVDTPGPAILGLPSCERLEVVKINCAVKVIQDTSCLPGPTPTPKKQLQSSLQRTPSESSKIVSKA